MLVIALFVGGTGAAAAAGLLTGKDIENGSLGAKELKKKLRQKINKAGTAGAPGTPGTPGADGADGADATYVGPHWGVIDRNTIGSAVADLRAGPFGSFSATNNNVPPFGDGSLGIQVSDAAMSGGDAREKAAFGNEVDFLGDPVAGVTDVGFNVFQTGENGASNLPNITFEIDSNLNGSLGGSPDYTSMVFVPAAQTFSGGGSWTGYIDATDGAEGYWYLTGTEGSVSGCDQATQCSFSELQTALQDGTGAVIYTLYVGYGRDGAWVGAIDGLRLNATTYDFEPFGVNEVATP